MLIVLASFAVGCVASAVYAVYACCSPPPAIELQTVWAVHGVVFTGDDEHIFEYGAEFAAPTRLEAARQYGDHVRSFGWWVGGISDVYRNGMVTVPRKGAKA